MKTTTATAYTPGPWSAHAYHPTGKDADARWQIFWVSAGGDDGDICHIYTGPHRDVETAEANTRLIAAAPELLEAAQAMWAHLTDSQTRTHVDAAARLKVLDDLHRAIRKAEGESAARS